jgi:branched-chain amino acid transport system permease protein
MAVETPDSGGVGRDRGPIGRLRAALEGPNTVGNSRPFWVGFVVVLAGVAALPMVLGPFGSQQFALYFAYIFLGLSLSLVWGYGGILSFGQVAFFGVAGYTFGIVTLNVASPLGVTGGLVGGVLAGALGAFLLGYFMFYGGVTDVYVTIITLVAALVLHTFMAQTAGSEWAVGAAQLGGFNGMPGIPQLTLGVGETAIAFTGSWFYWLLFGLVVCTYLGLRVLVNSDFGRVAVAVREDPQRTRMFGYDVKRVKLLMFTLGGALAGLGGVMFTAWGNYINPDVFSLSFAALPVVWVSIGGRESLIGAVLGTLAVSYLNEWLSVNAPDFALIVIGALLLGVIMFLPAGVVPRVEALIERHWPERFVEAPESRVEARNP